MCAHARVCVCVCIINRHTQGRGPCNPIMNNEYLPTERSGQLFSCSHTQAWVISTNLTLKSQGNQGNELFSAYSGILKKYVLTRAKECLSSRIDELASKSEGKQVKSKSSLLPCLLCELSLENEAQIQGLSSNNPDLRWIFSLQMIQARKSFTGMPSSWVLVDSRCSHLKPNKISRHWWHHPC